MAKHTYTPHNQGSSNMRKRSHSDPSSSRRGKRSSSCPPALPNKHGRVRPPFNPLDSLAKMFPTCTLVVVIFADKTHKKRWKIHLLGEEPQGWAPWVKNRLTSSKLPLASLSGSHGVTILNPNNATTSTRRRELTADSLYFPSQLFYTLAATQCNPLRWKVETQQHAAGKEFLSTQTVQEMAELALNRE